MFHRHRWDEVRRYFVPPVRREIRIEIRIESPKEVRRILNGFTVLELRCKGCGDVTHRELPGHAEGDEA